MKQINLFKSLLLVASLAATSIVNAQIHPLAFGVGTYNTNPNWYADYVGLRFEVVSPAFDAGNKVYTTTNSGSTPWGGAVTSPIVNIPISMPQSGDSACNVGAVDHTITTNMTGKIGVVYRGASVYFGDKAADCQNAGAIACVIINNVPGAPVGMGIGGAGSSVTIPVFMISKADGDVLDSLYNAGVVANITITSWGQSLRNDLGFVPGGTAMWHAYAVPSNQITASGNPTAYNMLDGAFIANYGTSAATGVKLKSSLTFTPTAGVATPVHTAEVDLSTPFTVADSIYAMFNSTEYPLNQVGSGRYDLTYLIESDTTDQYPSDNTQTISFYASDTVFSKGSYDFTSNQPMRSSYESFGGGVEFLWGPMYYVAKSTMVSGVQYALAMNSTTTGYPYLPTSNNIFIFKWVDGSVGSAPDSLVEDGELQLVGSAVKTYNGFSDTSEALLYQQIYSDTGSGNNGASSGGVLTLDSNSWYYVCIDVPATTFLGCDGSTNDNPFPRVYGRYHANVGASGNHLLDYSSLDMVYSTAGFMKDSLYYYAGQGVAPIPSGMTGYLNSVDSFVYSNLPGLIPAVALTITNNPLSVKNVSTPLGNVSVYPNPAKDQLNVAVTFDKMEPSVSYEIIDGLARFVGKETHTNVKSETYTVNTAKLAAGNYYLIINAEGKVMTKKFVVTK